MFSKKIFNDAFLAISISACALAIPTLGLCFVLPLYGDEVAWKIIDGHYLADGRSTLVTSGWPDCGNLSFPVAWPLVPYRVLDSWLYDSIDNPLWIRLSGVFIAIFTLALITTELHRVMKPEVRLRTVLLGVLGVATLGVLPLMLVMSRPEQAILPIVAVMAIRSSSARDGQQKGTAIDWATGIGIAFAAGVALTTHQKAIFFAPVFVVAGIILTQRWGPKIAAVAITLLTAAYAYPYWVVRTVCPDNPVIESQNATRSLFLALQSHQTAKFFRQALRQNPVDFLFVHRIILRQTYMSSWLPDYPSYGLADKAVFYSMGILLSLFLFAGFVALFRVLRDLWRARGRDPSSIAIATLWGCTLVPSLTQVTRLDYEATLIVPLLVLAATLSLWRSRFWIAALIGPARTRSAAAISLLVLLGYSVISQVYLLVVFAPEVPAWTTRGYIAKQVHSISVFGYSQLHQNILDAAARCGIRPEDRPRHLIVDLLTSLSFPQSYQPLFEATTDLDEAAPRIRDDHRDFQRLGSAGAIVSCSIVPPEVSESFVRDGMFCCHKPY